MDIQAYLTAPIPRWIGLVAVVATAVAGVGATAFTMNRRFDRLFSEKVEEEVARTNVFLNTIGSKEYGTPQEAVLDLGISKIQEPSVEKLRETLVDLQYDTDDETGDKVEVAKNVFTDAKDYEFDMEAELKKRTPEKPYILEHNEFFESENQMVTLTWFEGDEVLSDEHDEHVPDIDRVIGEDNLLRFGYGSGDPNILYVRNEKMEIDFEVVKNEGKYTEQILGFVQHEDRPGPRKFRTYDD